MNNELITQYEWPKRASNPLHDVALFLCDPLKPTSSLGGSAQAGLTVLRSGAGHYGIHCSQRAATQVGVKSLPPTSGTVLGGWNLESEEI